LFYKKKQPLIFGYNSYNNGPIYVKFAANVRYRINLISACEYNAEQVAMQSIQYSQTVKK